MNVLDLIDKLGPYLKELIALARERQQEQTRVLRETPDAVKEGK